VPAAAAVAPGFKLRNRIGEKSGPRQGCPWKTGGSGNDPEDFYMAGATGWKHRLRGGVSIAKCFRCA
jgi:hypothetical protein